MDSLCIPFCHSSRYNNYIFKERSTPTNTSVALALRTLVVLIFSIIIVAIVGSQGQIYLIDKKHGCF